MGDGAGPVNELGGELGGELGDELGGELGGGAVGPDDLRSILVRVLPSGWDRPVGSRDQAAFDADVRNAWLVVFHRTAAVVRDRREAEEITQEVFCRVLGRMAADHGDAPLRAAYLKTAARNLVYDRWRRQDRVRELGAVYGGDRSSAPVAVEDEVMGRMDAEAVRAAMRSLPAMQRRVLRLRIFEGLTAEVAGVVIGKEAAAVRQIQHRALQALRSQLADAPVPDHGGKR